MKKVISTFLAMTFVAAMLCTGAVAVSEEQPADTQEAVDLQQLIEQSGLTDEEVAEAQEIYGDELPEVLEEYIAQTDWVQPRITAMTEAEWTQLTATMDTGVIIVSKDQKTGVRHGHAALCWKGTTVIEHPGKKDADDREVLSLKQDASVTFEDLGAVATFLPNNVTTQQKAQAAYYAENKLIGWKYGLLAPREDAGRMNCATLVWKAYHYANVDVCKPGSGTVYPSELDLDGYNRRLYATKQYSSIAWPFSDDIPVTE